MSGTDDRDRPDSDEQPKKRRLRFPPEPVLVLGIIVALPIFIPAAIGVLAWTEWHERRKKCLKCGSKRFEIADVGASAAANQSSVDGDSGSAGNRRGSSIEEVDGNERGGSRRLSPPAYLKCTACGAQWKTRWGEPLVEA